MARTATVIVLSAGGITFVNQWYQTHQADWKVPVATLFIAAGVDALSNLDNKAANILALMILMGAATTKFNNHSFVDTLTDLTKNKPKGKK